MSNGTLKALKPGLEKQKEQDQDSVFCPSLPFVFFFRFPTALSFSAIQVERLLKNNGKQTILQGSEFYLQQMFPPEVFYAVQVSFLFLCD